MHMQQQQQQQQQSSIPAGMNGSMTYSSYTSPYSTSHPPPPLPPPPTSSSSSSYPPPVFSSYLSLPSSAASSTSAFPLSSIHSVPSNLHAFHPPSSSSPSPFHPHAHLSVHAPPPHVSPSTAMSLPHPSSSQLPMPLYMPNAGILPSSSIVPMGSDVGVPVSVGGVGGVTWGSHSSSGLLPTVGGMQRTMPAAASSSMSTPTAAMSPPYLENFIPLLSHFGSTLLEQSENFYKTYVHFMSDSGTPLADPIVYTHTQKRLYRRQVDLFELYRSVVVRGGFRRVFGYLGSSIPKQEWRLEIGNEFTDCDDADRRVTVSENQALRDDVNAREEGDRDIVPLSGMSPSSYPIVSDYIYHHRDGRFLGNKHDLASLKNFYRKYLLKFEEKYQVKIECSLPTIDFKQNTLVWSSPVHEQAESVPSTVVKKDKGTKRASMQAPAQTTTGAEESTEQSVKRKDDTHKKKQKIKVVHLPPQPALMGRAGMYGLCQSIEVCLLHVGVNVPSLSHSLNHLLEWSYYVSYTCTRMVWTEKVKRTQHSESSEVQAATDSHSLHTRDFDWLLLFEYNVLPHLIRLLLHPFFVSAAARMPSSSSTPSLLDTWNELPSSFYASASRAHPRSVGALMCLSQSEYLHSLLTCHPTVVHYHHAVLIILLNLTSLIAPHNFHHPQALCTFTTWMFQHLIPSMSLYRHHLLIHAQDMFKHIIFYLIPHSHTSSHSSLSSYVDLSLSRSLSLHILSHFILFKQLWSFFEQRDTAYGTNHTYGLIYFNCLTACVQQYQQACEENESVSASLLDTVYLVSQVLTALVRHRDVNANTRVPAYHQRMLEYIPQEFYHHLVHIATLPCSQPSLSTLLEQDGDDKLTTSVSDASLSARLHMQACCLETLVQLFVHSAPAANRLLQHEPMLPIMCLQLLSSVSPEGVSSLPPLFVYVRRTTAACLAAVITHVHKVEQSKYKRKANKTSVSVESTRSKTGEELPDEAPGRAADASDGANTRSLLHYFLSVHSPALFRVCSYDPDVCVLLMHWLTWWREQQLRETRADDQHITP